MRSRPGWLVQSGTSSKSSEGNISRGLSVAASPPEAATLGLFCRDIATAHILMLSRAPLGWRAFAIVALS
jgi:hypothetical protein